jgi:hypothetical protein
MWAVVEGGGSGLGRTMPSRSGKEKKRMFAISEVED